MGVSTESLRSLLWGVRRSCVWGYSNAPVEFLSCDYGLTLKWQEKEKEKKEEERRNR